MKLDYYNTRFEEWTQSQHRIHLLPELYLASPIGSSDWITKQNTVHSEIARKWRNMVQMLRWLVPVNKLLQL